MIRRLTPSLLKKTYNLRELPTVARLYQRSQLSFSPMRVTSPHTRALPMKKARLPGVTLISAPLESRAISVCPTGNMFPASSSSGVNRRNLPTEKQSWAMTHRSVAQRFAHSRQTRCLNLEGDAPPSDVMIVRIGRSIGSGIGSDPSANLYSKRLLAICLCGIFTVLLPSRSSKPSGTVDSDFQYLASVRDQALRCRVSLASVLIPALVNNANISLIVV